MPDTPMIEGELKPPPQGHQASRGSRDNYQRIVGSILLAAISTRPDIAFAASRLGRYNQNPDDSHHEAADRVIKYLYSKNLCIRYGHNNATESFICASDSSFADNTIDRKSSQGYIMFLFGGAIGWRANKQDAVTTSSTEAELVLALSQTAKEAIFMSRLFKALSLELNQPLRIRCDNRQTLRLFDESVKLVTRLRLVDI
jgi:hypothetical protein